MVEFDHFKTQAGLPSFVLSPTQWVEKTNAIGIFSKTGRYGGTYAHKDIAFEDLIIGLNKIYQREWKSIGFSPIEKQFSMQFDLQENGHVNVHVKLSNPMFTGKFEFEYVTDQTFIPELIKEIEIAMKENA